MHGIHDLDRLLDHGEHGSDRHISASLAHLDLGGAPDAAPGLDNLLHERHQWRHLLRVIGQRHRKLPDRHAAGFNLRRTARRNAEDVGILPARGFGGQKSGEIGEHAVIEHETPCRRGRIRGIAEDMQQSDIVKSRPRRERELDEHLFRGR